MEFSHIFISPSVVHIVIDIRPKADIRIKS